MNNLSSREKTLAFIVAGIVPVVVLFFGFTYFIGQKNKKSQELTNVTQQLSDIQFREDQAELKRFAQNQFKQRSLASDVSIAKSEYREWLQGLVEKKIGFDGPPKVTYTAAVPYKSDFGQNKELYTKLNFQLDCSGSYKQIVDFLYQFYEKNYLNQAFTHKSLNSSPRGNYERLEFLGFNAPEDYEFVANIHDEFQIECKERYAERFIGPQAESAIKRAGEYFEFGCPLSGTFKIGRNWAETH